MLEGGTERTLIPQVTSIHRVNDGLHEAYDRKERSSCRSWQIQNETNLTGDRHEHGEKLDDLCKWIPRIAPSYTMLASCLYKQRDASIIETRSDGLAAFTLWSRKIHVNIS